jgi:hypothetical protein
MPDPFERIKVPEKNPGQRIAPYASGSGSSLVKATGQVYTVANSVPDRSYDASTVLIAELAQVVAALIADLKTAGLIN